MRSIGPITLAFVLRAVSVARLFCVESEENGSKLQLNSALTIILNSARGTEVICGAAPCLTVLISISRQSYRI